MRLDGDLRLADVAEILYTNVDYAIAGRAADLEYAREPVTVQGFLNVVRVQRPSLTKVLKGFKRDRLITVRYAAVDVLDPPHSPAWPPHDATIRWLCSVGSWVSPRV